MGPPPQCSGSYLVIGVNCDIFSFGLNAVPLSRFGACRTTRRGHNIWFQSSGLYYTLLKVWATLVRRLVPSNQDLQESRLSFHLGLHFGMWWAWDRHATRYHPHKKCIWRREAKRRLLLLMRGRRYMWQLWLCVWGFLKCQIRCFVMNDRLVACSSMGCVLAAV